MFDYRFYRRRYQPRIVTTEPGQGWLTIKEAAQYFGRSTQTIREWCFKLVMYKKSRKETPDYIKIKDCVCQKKKNGKKIIFFVKV